MRAPKNEPDKRIPEPDPAVERLSRSLVTALEAFENAGRHYRPGIAHQLRETFSPILDLLKEARDACASDSAPPDAVGLRKTLLEAADLCGDALRLSTETEWTEQSLVNFRKAGRRICRVREMIYPLHRLLPPVNLFFLEEAARDKAEKYACLSSTPSPVGLVHVGLDEDPYARAGFSLYVPECDDAPGPIPLVIALHGGFGHGRDFIWMWLREARSRRFMLAAPSSRGITWTITGHDFDSMLLHDMLEHILGRWNVDEQRILLTGFSDGGTYALMRALDEESPFTAYAVCSCILPPFDLRHVKGRRIYWVHGAKDWMFPPWRAKTGEKELIGAGADITLKIVPDLYHAYPREEDGSILEWFDPSLALLPP